MKTELTNRMRIKPKKITIGELVDGYNDDGSDGVVGFSGTLDIRPPYQREFVYSGKQRDDVIRSVLAGFPLNVMYWATQPNGRFEVLDGQQRTISIGQYVNGDFSIEGKYFHSQPDDVQEHIRGYELTIYVCDGPTSEKLKWFEIVNIPGEELKKQELRNAVYPGSWLTDAKRHFSKPGCPAKEIGDAYVKGTPIRQELLELAIKWATDGTIDDYMSLHQHDVDATGLWLHFQTVIEWVSTTFFRKRPIMRDVDWGSVYAKHKNDDVDPDKLEEDIRQLLSLQKPGVESVIRKPSGVYLYVLDGDERHLNLRTFSRAQKTVAYERQGGKCADCGKVFEYGQMEGDHILPWKEGGLTIDENLQMLCKPCNQSKGAN